MRQEGDFIIQLIPMLVIWLAFALPVYYIAKRKGVSTSGMIVGMFPLWMVLVAIWWASLPDKDLLDRLDRLEGKQ